jgi:hypothetical protein
MRSLSHGERPGEDAEAESSEVQEVGECRARIHSRKPKRKRVDELDARDTHGLAAAERARGFSSLGSVFLLN